MPSFFVTRSLDAVKKKLAEAEAREAATGVSLPHKLHPSSFVRMGLEIEDQQYVSHFVVQGWPLILSNLGNR